MLFSRGEFCAARGLSDTNLRHLSALLCPWDLPAKRSTVCPACASQVPSSRGLRKCLGRVTRLPGAASASAASRHNASRCLIRGDLPLPVIPTQQRPAHVARSHNLRHTLPSSPRALSLSAALWDWELIRFLRSQGPGLWGMPQPRRAQAARAQSGRRRPCRAWPRLSRLHPRQHPIRLKRNPRPRRSLGATRQVRVRRSLHSQAEAPPRRQFASVHDGCSPI